MFWFDKHNPYTTYMDIRKDYEKLGTGHIIDVAPDVLADFRDMPFSDDSYDLVVFDPPHLVNAGDNSWLVKKYGRLENETWPNDLKQGMAECMRVLKPTGTLVFKWNEEQISLRQVLTAIAPYVPILGNKRSKTHWLVFIKS